MRIKHPGHLTRYARHAGISKQAASEQLKRVGIDYMQPFDFQDADRRREAMRHADRAPFVKSRPLLAAIADIDEDKKPVFAKVQYRREHFRAELARLEFEERLGKLVDRASVEAESFLCGRLVRDTIMNIPSRLAGILAAENDQRKVHDLLEKELRQALESLASDDSHPKGTAAA